MAGTAKRIHAGLERILLVEDEIDIQMVACMALEDLGGFTVERASSAAEALAKAASFRPQLVLLDYMLPDRDGRQTLEALRRIPGLETTPVVYVTARARESEIAEYLESGALAVIVKPFDAMQLAATVSSIWDRHQAAG
jgi:CheY-like chemotaxis protein